MAISDYQSILDNLKSSQESHREHLEKLKDDTSIPLGVFVSLNTLHGMASRQILLIDSLMFELDQVQSNVKRLQDRALNL